MSTKIYNAFRIGTTDLRTIQARSMRARTTFRESAATKVAAKLASIAVARIDKLATGQPVAESKLGPYMYAFDEILSRQSQLKATGRRDPEVDFEFSVVIIPVRHFAVGICFTEQTEWINPFIRIMGAREYSYWNNTDKPDRVSQREWDLRAAVWDEAVGNESPAMRGFILELTHSPPTMPMMEDVLKNVPSLNERVKPIVADVLWQHWMTKEPVTPSNAVSAFMEFRKWMNDTEEGRSAAAAQREIILRKIPHTISSEMLLED